jgi:3-methylfumaryl-CoA hydratase
MEPSTAPGIDLDDWVGRTEQAHDVLHATPARALALTLDRPDIDVVETGRLPELWHWLYFLPLVPTSGLGVDGHPRRGGFLPPVALERRMWAGGRLRFHRDLHVGEPVTRDSEIVSIASKQGKAGPMVLLTVRRTIASPAGVAVEDEQDIVYLAKPTSQVAPPPDPVPDHVEWTQAPRVDPVLLFRFSALTFNSHRIHYDLTYATEQENYAGLVVHGPLQAVLLMESARAQHPGKRVATFAFRAARPIFAHDTLHVSGWTEPDGHVEVVTANGDGDVAMRAQVMWADQ